MAEIVIALNLESRSGALASAITALRQSGLDFKSHQFGDNGGQEGRRLILVADGNPPEPEQLGEELEKVRGVSSVESIEIDGAAAGDQPEPVPEPPPEPTPDPSLSGDTTSAPAHMDSRIGPEPRRPAPEPPVPEPSVAEPEPEPQTTPAAAAVPSARPEPAFEPDPGLSAPVDEPEVGFSDSEDEDAAEDEPAASQSAAVSRTEPTARKEAAAETTSGNASNGQRRKDSAWLRRRARKG